MARASPLFVFFNKTQDLTKFLVVQVRAFSTYNTIATNILRFVRDSLELGSSPWRVPVHWGHLVERGMVSRGNGPAECPRRSASHEILGTALEASQGGLRLAHGPLGIPWGRQALRFGPI